MLTAQHIANAIAVLERAQRLTPNTDPRELGTLVAHAAIAAVQLRIYSGLDKITIPVKAEEEAAQ